ncbi:lipocalin family protein [Moheibacter stercoris]|uniref:Lipocalin-like domain-containing protein n=1 Tax=Moheibacter stercoris TaxID=1628251 RepID=A0ABV2LQN8_9FLAO
MRTIFILMVGILFLTACKGDDDNNPVTPDIAGKWKVTKITSEMTTSSIYAIGEGIDYNGYMTFESNPNKVFGEGEVLLEIKMYIDGVLVETMQQTISLANQFETGQWEISGNNLTLSGQNSDVTMTITEINNNTMKLTYTPTDTNVVKYEFTRIN